MIKNRNFIFRIKALSQVVVVLSFSVLASGADLVSLSQLKEYIQKFNLDDTESFKQSYPNEQAFDFLSANIPLFECPDKELERIYYFRWWTFRKHLQNTPEGWVITEFLPKVPWGGKYNTINCAAAHHIREGRWLKDQKYIRDYFQWWLFKGGKIRAYSFWIADSLMAWCDSTGDYRPAIEWLPALIKNYEAWEKSSFDPSMGLFIQRDDCDGMESSISRGGYRPTINSYMYGDALAIARIAQMCGKEEVSRLFLNKANQLKSLVQTSLWNTEQDFFQVRKTASGLGILKWKINDDDTLTKNTKASASAPGPVDQLNDGVVPPSSRSTNASHFDFDDHRGTEEWIQYDLQTTKNISNLSIYLMSGANLSPPDKYRILYKTEGIWTEAKDLAGSLDRYNQWNKLTFSAVETDSIRLELTLKGNDRSSLKLANVRELLGYIPWYFNLPDEKYSVAWKQLIDPKVFSAPFGLTTAEQRHPQFKVSYEGHECQWNGPIWPFATAQTLTALANLLNNYSQSIVDRNTYFDALSLYARSHQLKLQNGKVVPWIDENQDPYTGAWIAHTRILNWEKKDPVMWQKKGGTSDRGKDYNHSTFCDLVINGLVGIRPQSDDTVVINPLVPEGKWDYFCLDRVSYRGKSLAVLWDKTGTRYHKGSGLRVFADGKEIAQSDHLSKVTGKLSH